MRGTPQPVTKRQAKTPCTAAPSSEFEIIIPLTAAAFVTAAMLYWLAA